MFPEDCDYNKMRLPNKNLSYTIPMKCLNTLSLSSLSNIKFSQPLMHATVSFKICLLRTKGKS